jgi:hypothetical protein
MTHTPTRIALVLLRNSFKIGLAMSTQIYEFSL